MNKSFYFFGLFFLGLVAATQLGATILIFRIGNKWVTLESAAEAYLFLLIISAIPSFFLLRYYHAKKYWFAFGTLAVDIAAGLCLGIMLYLAILTKEPNSYYYPLSIFGLAASTVYAVSLIASQARKNLWLSIAGIWLLLSLLLRLPAFIPVTATHGVHAHELAETCVKWSNVALGLAPILFILQFLKEASRLKWKAPAEVGQRMSAVLLGIAGVAVIIWMIFRLVALDKAGHGEPQDTPISDNAAMEARSFEACIYVDSNGDKLPYRLLKPLDYVPGKQYPLVVCLHHGGAHGTDNIRQVEAAEPAWTLRQGYNMQKHPAFIFVPQCPPGFCWGGIPHFPAVDSLVFAAILSLERQYSIDVSRVYVAGISMGGYGSWHFICSRPKMFAAAIPICGGGDTAVARNAVDIPVWAFHGARDRNVPVQQERDMINAVKKAGGHPLYTEFPEGNHNIWNQVSQNLELVDWLFAQKRAD